MAVTLIFVALLAVLTRLDGWMPSTPVRGTSGGQRAGLATAE